MRHTHAPLNTSVLSVELTEVSDVGCSSQPYKQYPWYHNRAAYSLPVNNTAAYSALFLSKIHHGSSANAVATVLAVELL
eukprot:4572-Heterococcus_DN1.PRE.5